jgi:hypothetical protein
MCCILGLLLCAKTKLAKAQLAAYFAEGATNAGKSRDETDICKARKISKFYRALVTGILENDEVLTFPPHFCYGKFIVCYYLEGISAFFFHPLSITHGALGPHSQYATLEELENDQISLTT